MIKVAVLGATGRMGQAIITALAGVDDIGLAGAVTRVGDASLGQDAGQYAGVKAAGVPLTDDRAQAMHQAQVAIDFTLPSALDGNLRSAVESGTALVIGTTGLSPEQMKAVEKTAHEVPIVYGRNMSVGMNVFMHFVAEAARTLGEDYDAEIVEAHHRHKVDAPSGTALALGEAIAQARQSKLEDLAVRTRDGQTGPRVPGTIGFSTIRGGGIVGDHTVMFISADERVEFTHRAADRGAFASGALRAARWVAGRAPGLYSMADVLDL